MCFLPSKWLSFHASESSPQKWPKLAVANKTMVICCRGALLTFVVEDPNFDYCRVAMGDNATETLQSRMEARQ